ncbi:MAG: radical SAM protein [Spirochaetes bacterium]|nr:radical SAM protein [Spirochaetota bacterium]
MIELHRKGREQAGLPCRPPKHPEGIQCRLCANNCSMGEGDYGFCGLRKNEHDQLVEESGMEIGRAHTYLDHLPTNCCASWFCRGSEEEGYNLAVFLYGCSFDCLYCQNSEHKLVEKAPALSVGQLVERAADPRVACVCFFGGSPEPQFPFVFEAAERISAQSKNRKHICFEWNGSGNPSYVRRAVQIAHDSGGTVKFDLKAFHPNIHAALCGVEGSATMENFTIASNMYPDVDVLTATTLLVPYYVDEREVGGIASTIAHANPRIPYSLLVFHPDYYLEDLPVTPREQVFSCYDVAISHLQRVHIGNKNLL